MKLIVELKKKLKKFYEDSKKRDAESLLFSLLKPEHYPTLISQQARWRLNIFRETTFLSRGQKDIILPKIRSLVIKLSRLIIIQARISFGLSLLLGLFWLPLFLGIGSFSQLSISANPWNSWNLSSYNLPGNSMNISLLAFWAYIFISDFMDRKSTDEAKSRHTFTELLLSFGGITIFISFSNWISISLFSFVIYTLLFGIFVRCLFHYIKRFIDVLINFFMDLFGYDKLPESIVVHNILRILDEIKLHPEFLSDLKLKIMVLTRLDYVADAVGRNIPNLLKTRNSEFNSSIKVTSQNIANSIRDRKLWVLTPKDDTAQYLANYLANFLFHFIKGDWDTLERLETPELTLYEKWTKRYLPLLRPIIFIGVPIIAFWGLKLSNLTNEPWAGTVFSYIILWIIINIIWLIDPTAKEKMGSFKDATGLF